MPELVAIVQTTWRTIRMGLYKREDGRFQFAEEGIQADAQGDGAWVRYMESGIYDDLPTATSAMIDHYCSYTEDEYVVDPKSVTVLEAPDFSGAHHPVLVRR